MPTKSINIREMLLGRPVRLRYITRFSICPRTHDESVAEHSYYTAFYALLLGMDLQMKGHKVEMGVVQARALMHDVDEAYSGDFIRMFKHSTPSLKLAIDQACNQFVKKFKDAVTPGIDIHMLWKNSKYDDLEGAIVSVADFMSVVSYIGQELNSGNRNMLEHIEDLWKFYDGFWDIPTAGEIKEKYKPLKDYILDCGDIMKTLSMIPK